MLYSGEVRNKIALAGSLSTAAMGASLPISTSMLNITSGLVFFFWLLSGSFSSLPGLVRHNIVSQAFLLLLIAFLIGATYSTAGLADGFHMLSKYRKLLLIVVIMPLLTSEKTRLWAKLSFVLGMLVALTASYGMYLGIFPPTRWGASLLSPITHSVLMAFFTYLVGRWSLSSSPYRLFWIAAALAALANILFIVTGRTGQVILIALALLFIWQLGAGRRRLVGISILLVLLVAGLSLSTKFAGLIVDTVSDMKAYNKNETFTDVGIRLEWYRNTIKLIRQKPFYGWGTGSFQHEYASLAAKKNLIATDNPHNEYLNIAAQLGLVGLLLYLFLFFNQWRAAKKLNNEDKCLAQALVLCMALGCLANSFLMDSHEGTFFVYFSALLFASMPRGMGPSPVPAGNLARQKAEN